MLRKVACPDGFPVSLCVLDARVGSSNARDVKPILSGNRRQVSIAIVLRDRLRRVIAHPSDVFWRENRDFL